MSKFLVVTPGYPSNDNKYNNAFVHSRVIQYIKNGLNVDVFSVSKKQNSTYQYEGVNVVEGTLKDLSCYLKESKFDKILIHFAWEKTVKTILKFCPNTKLIVWVHGVEALGWYRRLFLFDIKKFYRFFGYILVNIKQMMFFRKFIRNKKVDVTFVFVSDWMKKILETDTLSKGRIRNFIIIPNVVDDNVFKYRKKKVNDRFNILSIRPYANKKYANDISVKAVNKLSKYPEFSKLHFTFYGKGKLFAKTLKSLYKYSNVEIHEQFLSQKEISIIHADNGIMLIPTRQDAQGVSMCEAMSSGLVPISSNNTAIPEYLSEECGYLTNNADDIVHAILEMVNNPDLFLKKSKNAFDFVRKKCSPKVVIQKELELIEKNESEE